MGDFKIPATLPHNEVDYFICTQTLNFIYDFKAAIAGIHHRAKNELRYRVVRLKYFLSKKEFVDMLKIDIEGAKTEVIIDCDMDFVILLIQFDKEINLLSKIKYCRIWI